MGIYKIITSAVIMLTVSSCSVQDIKEDITKKTVKRNLSGSMFETFQCSRNLLKTSNVRRTIILVGNIPDGTVPSRQFNGALTDAGNTLLKSSLVELIPNSAGVVPEIIPSIFLKGKGGSVNEYGSVPKSSVDKYTNYSKSYFKGKKVQQILLLKGAFTRFDADPSEQSEKGFSLGNDGTDGSGELSLGKSYRKRGITLTINIVEPLSNAIVSTQSFFAEATNGQRELKIKLGPGEGAIGYTQSFQKSLSPHEIQQYLIDVSALWFANKAFSNAKIKNCLSVDKKRAITDIK